MKYELDSMNNLPTAPSYFAVKSESTVFGDHLYLWWLTYQKIPENLGKRQVRRVRWAISCHDVGYESYGDLIPRRIRAARCNSSSDHGMRAVKAIGEGSAVDLT